MTTVRAQPELTNARSRIVGEREGRLADAIVATVRGTRAVRTAIVRASARLGATVTTLGWSMALLVTAGFVIGYTLGWTEAIVIAWTGVFVLALASIYLIGRNPHQIRLVLPSTRVVVGERAPGEVILTNPLNRRIPGVRVEVPVGLGLAEFAMPSLGRGGQLSDLFVIPTQRRGVVPVGPVRAVRADPVGLVRREIVWEERFDLYVHPRTIAIPSMSTGFIRDLEGAATRVLTSSDVAFHALREYQPGDEPRSIHWKSTAKAGSYMVRQYEETRRSHLLVALSLASGDFASDDEFELAVSVAGSLGVRAIRDSRSLSVLVSDRTPDFAKRSVVGGRELNTITRTRLLDELAAIEVAEGAVRLPELARVASDAVAGASIVFLVCGSTVTPAMLRSAASRFPLEVDVVAVLCEVEALPRVRRVADLSVITIGYLEDLQKSLARRAAVV